MAYDAVLYEVSGNGLTIALNQADRVDAFTLDMGREIVEASTPLLVDEYAGNFPAAGDAPQNRVKCGAGGSP